MLYNVIWGRGVVKNMTFSRYIIYGWPLRTLVERSQQLVTVSQEKIQEDVHVEEALRACGYPL